jgi:hypothetical protein
MDVQVTICNKEIANGYYFQQNLSRNKRTRNTKYYRKWNEENKIKQQRYKGYSKAGSHTEINTLQISKYYNNWK